MLEKITSNWDQILEILKTEYDISEIAINTWLSPLGVYSVDGNNLTLSYSDNNMKLSYVLSKYKDFIKMAINDVVEQEFNINICSLKSLKENNTNLTPDINNTSAVYEQKLSYSNINQKYTFDSFIVGSNNNIAQAASLAVAESPGEIYNPLFIYGGAGLGKTHLMHAIGNYIINTNPNKKVLYASSEEFTNELVSIIRNDNQNQSAINDFREKYRSVDVLLIDDIQFIIGKERTQEEFFHTFNTLFLAKKQIVISSDKPPKDMELLEERLSSRFSNGLTVDIQKPDYETRLAILNKKAEIEHYNIPDDVFNYVVENITSNVRDLEGALIKIVAFSKLSNQDITLEFSENVLSDVINPTTKTITVDLIIDTVAEHYGIKREDIISKKKNQEIAYPRQICMYLSRQLTDETFSNIAKALNRKDHSTIMHGAEKIDVEIKNNPQTKDVIDIITKKINPN